MARLSYNEDYLRSDGSYLGDSHGDMPNGFNPVCSRVDTGGPADFPRRDDQKVAVQKLQVVMKLLFERVKVQSSEELNFLNRIPYGSIEGRSIYGVVMIERDMEYQGGEPYFQMSALEKLFEVMTTQRTYMKRVRRQARKDGNRIEFFFNYLQLLEECIRLCTITIDSIEMYDTHFLNQNMYTVGEYYEAHNPPNEDEDEDEH